MNKADLILELTKVLSTRKEAVSAVERAFDAMGRALRSGEKVVISGFGSFHVKMRKAKVGRNPRTGVVVPVPPRRGVKFTPARELIREIR